MPDPGSDKSIFSEELQKLLALIQHPMAQEFRTFVMQALKMQNEQGGKKCISFTPEILMEVADEVDMLLGIIHGLAEVIKRQDNFIDASGPKAGEYLS